VTLIEIGRHCLFLNFFIQPGLAENTTSVSSDKWNSWALSIKLSLITELNFIRSFRNQFLKLYYRICYLKSVTFREILLYYFFFNMEPCKTKQNNESGSTVIGTKIYHYYKGKCYFIIHAVVLRRTTIIKWYRKFINTIRV